MMNVVQAEPFLAAGFGLILLFFVFGLAREQSAKRRLAEQGGRYKHRLYTQFYLTCGA